MAEARPLAPVQAAMAQLERLDCLLKGLPPPKESLASMQQGYQSASTAAAAAASASADEPSHKCDSCGRGIENDLRRKMAGSGEIGGWRNHSWNGEGAEYRFHCSKCNVDLCSKCYDLWKAGGTTPAAGGSGSSGGSGGGGGGGGRVHPAECTFTIEAPITTPWGGNNYGPPPAPPPYNPGRRRGPWG